MPVAKKFIIASAFVLLIALILAVGVFLFIQYELMRSQTHEIMNEETASTTSEASAPTSASANIPAEGVPLRDLPLTDTQKSSLEKFNIDVDTFVVTPAMIQCAEKAVGSERYAEIMAGSAPSFMEGLSLANCIH